MNPIKDVTIILLAGGSGTRMGKPVPKQFLELNGKPVVRYSFDTLINLPSVAEMIVVCPESYQHLFRGVSEVPVRFALPGIRRQDSLYNGLQVSTAPTAFICIHDAARPFITEGDAMNVIEVARECGAAVVGTPVKSTIKQCDLAHFVTRTPDRTTLFEIQTPQVIRRDVLNEGFKFALEHDLTVTDDASLVELIKHPVKIVEGNYSNIKMTTPDDLHLASHLLSQNGK